MLERERCSGRTCDGARSIHDLTDRSDTELHAELVGVDERIERASVADVERDLPDPTDGDIEVERSSERRDARESDLTDTSIDDLDARLDEPAWRLDAHRGPRIRRVISGDGLDDAFLDRVATQRDRRVPTHRRVPLVVGEQHGEIDVRQVRFDEPDPVHVVVTARLGHQPASECVEMLACVATLLEDGGTEHGRQPVHDDAHRLAARMHLDGPDRWLGRHARLRVGLGGSGTDPGNSCGMSCQDSTVP